MLEEKPLACARDNGIVFRYFYKFNIEEADKIISIYIDDLDEGVFAYLEENGGITVHYINAEEKMNQTPLTNRKWFRIDKQKRYLVKLALVFISLLSQNVCFITAMVVFSIAFSNKIFDFIEIVYNAKKKNRRGYSIAKFHAAEHMVLDAFEKLGRTPTLKEVKNYSRFSGECGTHSENWKVLSMLVITLLILLEGELGLYSTIGAIALTVLISRLGIRYGWLKSMQVLSTAKPGDTELNVAIEGMKAIEEMQRFTRLITVYFEILKKAD